MPKQNKNGGNCIRQAAFPIQKFRGTTGNWISGDLVFSRMGSSVQKYENLTKLEYLYKIIYRCVF